MSSFVNNLVKRGAGLPVSPEYFPRPSHTVETGLGSGERPLEIASEEASDFRTEVPLATRPHPINTASTFSIPEVQRSSAMAASTPSQPFMEEPTTVFQPSSSGPDPLSPRSVISSSGPESLSPPSAIEIAQGTEPDLRNETLVTRHEFNERSAPTVAQTVVPPRQSTRVESNLPAITWGRREQQQGLSRPAVSAKAEDRKAQDTPELPSADQMIRPSATEPQILFHLPKTTSALPRSPATIPIHVRVGRIEVRGAPPQEPARSTPKESTPLGFASYHRMRRYRS